MMNRSMKGRGRTPGSRSRGARSAALVIPHPPPLVPTLTAGRTIRFIASGAVAAVAITVPQILDLFWMASSATVGYRTVAAFRIKRVRMWAPPGTTVPASCSLQWVGVTASNAVHQDTSIGATEPAYVESRPPPGDLAFWFGKSSTVTSLFNVSGPAGLIIDLKISVTSADAVVAGLVSRAVAGATAGTLYVSPLDSAGASLFIPQGVNTI